jgi:hypothetical protein
LIQLFFISFKDIIVLIIENNFDRFSSLDILELLQKVESTLRGVEFILESSLNQTDNMLINLFDLVHELIESALPLTTVGNREDISIVLESLKLLNLFLNLVDLIINLCSITSNSFKIRTENGIEFLNDDASFLKVLEDSIHMDRLLKDFLFSGKVPSLDSAALDVSLGVFILLSPLLKN